MDSQTKHQSTAGEGRYSILCVRMSYVFVFTFTHNKADDLKPPLETFVLVNYESYIIQLTRSYPMFPIALSNNVKAKIKKKNYINLKFKNFTEYCDVCN